MRHYASRGLLAVLSAFIAVTAIAGAIFVVPTLPLEWLEGSILVATRSLRSRSVSSADSPP